MRDLSKINTQVELVTFGVSAFLCAIRSTDNEKATIRSTVSEKAIAAREKLDELYESEINCFDSTELVEKLEALREETKKYKGVREASQLNSDILKLYEFLEVSDRTIRMEIEMYNATHQAEQAADVDLEKFKDVIQENIEVVRKQVSGCFMGEYYVVNLSINGPGCIALLLTEMKSSLKGMFHFVGKDLDSIQLYKYAPWNDKGIHDSVIYFVDDIDAISNKEWFAQRPGFNDLVADTKGRVMLRMNLVMHEIEKSR